jgi:hypothetical protein
MRIQIPSLLGLLLALPGLLQAESTIVPQFLQTADIPDDPYNYNGLLFVGSAIGSASFVGEGIIATAAHVIFDDEELVWEPINRIRYYPRYHRTTPFQPSGKLFPPTAFVRWTSYSARVENDDSGPGLSSPDTFNLDFAVGYLNKFEDDDLVMSYPEVSVDGEGAVGILRDRREKMIVGYPSDADFVPSGQRGLMHRTEPADYFCWWGGLEDFQDTWRDSEDYWVATYDFEGVTTYGGNSGGPMYVRDDEGQWATAGVVVGSNGSDGVLVRGIDEEAWNLIEEAIVTRDASTVFRVESVEATATGQRAVDLQWIDRSTGEAGYAIYRLDSGLWELLAELPADTQTFLDDTVEPGHVYQYKVQTVSENGNRTPKSPAVRTATPGSNALVGDFLAQPFLNLRNRGDSNWHIDAETRLRAGKVRSLGSSTLELQIIGPGTLRFDWSISSEENPDYANPSSQNYREIYDALHVYLDGQPVQLDDQPLFLSGFSGPVSREIDIPEGSHIVEWAYEKDPYTDEGEDTGFLDSLEWIPDGANPYPVLGGFSYEGTDWNGSTWLGAHEASDFPWVGHLEFGWLYLRPGNGIDLYLYSPSAELGDLYTRPQLFPFIYNYGRETWTYYIGGTGNFGQGMWFYDLNEEVYFRVN